MGGFEIEHAWSVDDAFKKMATGHYDVIISDYDMPQKDGLQFLKELRDQKNQIPFILFTGKGREEVAIKALNLGVDRYFNKQGNIETVYGELAHGIIQLSNQSRINKKLFEEEERFKQLFSSTPMAVVIYEVIDDGEDFVIKDLNPAVEKIEKIDKASILGKRLTHVFPGVKTFGIFEVFKRVWKTGKAKYFPAAIYQDSRDLGSWRENWVIKLPNDNIAAIYNDITERKKVENNLKCSLENERFLADLIRNASIAIAVAYPDGRLMMGNDAFKELTGYDEDELKRITWSAVLTPSEWREYESKRLEEINQSKKSGVYRKEYIRKDGSRVPIEIVVHPFFDNNGNISYYFGFITNITERKKVEEEMKKSEMILKNSTDLIITTDLQGKITSWNNGASEIFGYSAQEMIGENVAKLYMPPKKEKGAPQFETILKGQISAEERQAVRKNGTPVWLMLTTTLLKNTQNEPIGMAGFGKDISALKKNFSELTQLNQVLERVGESIDAGLAVISKDYRVVWANQRLRNLGVAPNKKCYETFNSLDTVCSGCGPKKVFEQNVSLDIHEYETVNSKGETVWVELRATPLKDKNGVTMAALELAVPITERKELEKKK